LRIRLTLAQKGMIAVSTILAFELLFVGTLAQMLNHAGDQLERENHFRETISHLNNLTHLWNQTTVGLTRVVQHAWMTSETDAHSQADPEFQKEYYQQPALVRKECVVLKGLVQGDPTASKAMDEIDNYCKIGLMMMEKVRTSTFEQNGQQYNWLTKLHRLGVSTVASEARLLKYYTELEEDITAQEARGRQTASALIATLIFFNIGIAFLISYLFTRSITRPLRTLNENSYRLASGKELHPVMKGTDEIYQLDQVFHQMAETLAEATQKERAIVENATDLICSISKDGRFSAINPAVEILLGYSADELLGQRYIQIVAEDQRNSLKNYLEQVAKSTSTTPLETQLLRKDATSLIAIWSAQWSNKDQMWFSVIHDISERKREENLIRASEERIRSVIENLPVGVVTTDSNGLVESINRMTSEMFTVEESEVLKKPISALFDGEVQSMKDLQAGKTLEQTAKKKSGETFPVEITTAEYQGVEGNRLLIHIKDITERREIERLKQEFIAMISHDLRTPLTSIGGTLTLIQEGIYGGISEGGSKRVLDAQRNVERLINLVSDLLDLEKLEAGRLTMELEPCDVADIIDQSVSSVKSYAEQKGVVLHVESAGAKIPADSDRLVQVLVNLISNAVKFSPVGGNVHVSSNSENGHVSLLVKDEGRGIPKEFQESIFERFQQVAASDGKRSMGSGLGLAICKAIVESHNGSIGVDSDGATGSTFWIRLPVSTS
jgi:PAS domain S-box-containing protein